MIEPADTASVADRLGGRHRAGLPGLRHCRELPGVGDRDGSDRTSRRPVTLRHRHPMRIAAQAATALVSVTGAAVLAVSAWYTATGATAVVLMIVR